MPRRQLNVSLSQAEYQWLLAAAEEAGEKPTRHARNIIVEAVQPAPETDLEAGLVAVPSWLLAIVLFLRGNRPAGNASQKKPPANGTEGPQR